MFLCNLATGMKHLSLYIKQLVRLTSSIEPPIQRVAMQEPSAVEPPPPSTTSKRKVVAKKSRNSHVNL